MGRMKRVVDWADIIIRMSKYVLFGALGGIVVIGARHPDMILYLLGAVLAISLLGWFAYDVFMVISGIVLGDDELEEFDDFRVYCERRCQNPHCGNDPYRESMKESAIRECTVRVERRDCRMPDLSTSAPSRPSSSGRKVSV